MPRYMVLAPVWLQAKGDASDRYYERGSVVEYDSVPSSAMAAMDDEARAVKTCANQHRGRERAQLDGEREKHLRTTLNRSQAAVLGNAERGAT